MPSMNQTVDALDQLLGRMGQLHASPTVAQKLLQLTRNPDFEIAAVASCLEHDPALAARILRVVNSARYGLARKVSNVRQATAFLGQRSLRLFAITFGLVETLTAKSTSPLARDYWPRALTLAMAASLLCERQNPKLRDEAYTSGLLADVGILVLAQLESRRYEPLFVLHDHGQDLLAAEETEFHLTHPQLGARLLELWEVPEGIVGAVASHHQTDAQEDLLARAVQAADLLSAAIHDPAPDKLFLSAIRLHQEFGLCRPDLIAFAKTLKEKLAEGEDLMDCGPVLAQRLGEFLTKLREGTGEE
jgi:HD-like signal output (HDOD) protein